MALRDYYANGCRICCCFCLLVLLLPLMARAQESGEEPQLEIGFDQRTRYIDFDNIIDYTRAIDDENRFFRFRTRVWARLLYHNLEFKLQLNNEFRHYYHPERDNSFDEIFVDLCYLKLDDLFGSGWSMIAGRQNIMRGEGFMLFDASPLDGSRSIYYNALLLSRLFGHSKLEFMGISNPYKDQYLPRIGDKDKALIEHDEQALAAMFSHTFASKATLEALYVYKRETSPYDPSEPAFTPERSLHIAGIRAVLPLGAADTFVSEIAGEFGREDPDRDVSAWAGYAYWMHRFAAAVKPQLKLSAGYFSGDDPYTRTDEGWSPPFSRWPKWSELYIYSFIRERGVAFWSNLWFANVECVIEPVKSLKLRFGYYKLMAPQAPAEPTDVFGTGTHRGDLFELRADLKLLKGLTGHVLYEYNRPGDFYFDDTAGHFFRIELNYRFSRVFGL